MTWDNWSDFEINCKVAIALGCDVVIEFSQSSSSVYCGYEGLESTQDERDYCNNPDDMWPIIQKNRISIYPSEGPDFMPWQAGCKSIMVTDKRPLRAAAIVFLMMKGVKPDDRI